MIQDLMRKHKRLLFAILLVFLIGPFVLWGGNFGGAAKANQAKGATAVAVVGDRPVPAETFRNYLQSERQQRAQFGGQAPTMQQMLQDGSAMKVLENLVGSELISVEADKGKYEFNQDYLIEKLKDRPEFKNEQGQFDPKAWNAAVEQVKNWNAYYDEERTQLARSLVITRTEASARVLDADIRKQFEKDNTSIALKYVAIAPKIEPTDEQIQETYNENKSKYDLPEKRRAEFVAISLVPPMPAAALDLVKRARDGEDFEKLAKENSTAPSKDTGGDLDWMEDGPIVRPHQKPLFALKKGEISEPIDGPNGYYIYKLEDERTNPTTSVREVKGREILVKAVLDEAATKAAQDKAKQVQEKAKASGDLKAVAAEAGLEVKTTGQFTIDSLNIENVSDSDARYVRSILSKVGLNEVGDVIEAQRNLYVAKVIELEAAVPQPLDVVKEKVKQDTIARIGDSPEYQKQCAELAASIQKTATSLQDILTQHPELGATIESLPAFTSKSYSFSPGLPMWNPREVMASALEKEPGAFFGPVADFTGKAYFIELVSKTPPDEKAWSEQYPKEEKQLKEQALSQEQNRRLGDYLAYLREQSLYQVDQAAFIRALGLAPEQQERPAESEAPAAGTDTTATPAAAPAGEVAAPAAEAAAAAPADGSASIAPAPAATPGAPAGVTPPANTPNESPAEVPAATPPPAPAAP